MPLLLAAGLALGVLSRVEETAPWSLGISTHATWLAAPFVAGALLRASAGRGAAAGAALLTAANAGYYAWITTTEPGVGLASVAGPVEHWLALGVAAGACFGALGATTRTGPVAARVAAPLAAAGVLVADALDLLAPLLP